MRKPLGWGLMLLCLGAVLGCTPLSVNMQHSVLRAGGDVVTTLFIERNDRVTAAGVLASADKLVAFLQSGDVSGLPLDRLEARLQAQVPVAYRPLVTRVMSGLSRKLATATGKIGKANVARMLALAKGIRTAAAEYTDVSCGHEMPNRDWERHGVGVGTVYDAGTHRQPGLADMAGPDVGRRT